MVLKPTGSVLCLCKEEGSCAMLSDIHMNAGKRPLKKNQTAIWPSLHHLLLSLLFPMAVPRVTERANELTNELDAVSPLGMVSTVAGGVKRERPNLTVLSASSLFFF
jgi:hypothetical protein